MTTERIEFQLSPEDRRALAQFVESNPGIEKLKPIARENLFLESRIIQAGGDPTSATGQGVGDEALRSRNEALKRRLATLQTPLRQGGPTVGEVRQSIPEPGIGTTETGERVFSLFPDQGSDQALNPASALQPSIAGFSARAQSEASPFARFAMGLFNDLTSPTTILSAGAGPAIAGSLRLGLAARDGSRFARWLPKLLGETPRTAALGEVGSSVAANAASAAGLPVPLQIAAGFAGGVGGAAAPVLTRTAVNQGQKAALGAAGAVADRVPAQLDRVSPIGTARAMGPGDVPASRPQVPDEIAKEVQGTRVVDETGRPRIVYHGSQNVFESFDPQASNPDALYGPGAYFTESPTVASGYARTRRSEAASPNVQPVALDIRNPFDIDAPLDSRVLRQVFDTPRDDLGFDALGSAIDDVFENGRFSRQLDAVFSRTDESGRNVLDPVSGNPVEEHERLLRVIEQHGTNHDLYQLLTAPFESGARAEANETLRSLGFDSITHIGGSRTGTDPHRVWIVLPDEMNTGFAGQIRPVVGTARAAGPEDIPEPPLPRDPLPPEDLDIIRRQIDNEAVRQSGRVPDSSIDRVVQTTRRIARNEPETPASVIDDQLLQLEENVAAARIRQEISGGSTPPPRKPGEPLMGGGDVPPPRRPERGLSDDLELPVHEKPQQGIFRKWSGARNVERLSIEQWFRRGEDTLRKAGIKRADENVAEMRDLFRALHGEISPEQLRRSLRPVYDDLRRLVDQETKDMADFLAQAKEADASLFGLDADNFTATMMAHPDYFPRGWRIPRNQPGVSGGRTGTRPGFTRPRVDASFSELLESGLLPASWDPYAMMARRRLAGVEYRETIRLIHRLKERGLVVGAAEAPEGWRVPRVGPAFEGRPVGIAEDGNTIFSKRLAVPNNRREGFIARELEGLFGSGEDISHLDWLRKISNSLKRMKLIGSVFQHVDIATRALGAGLTPTSIRRGGVFKTPALVTEMFKAQWWPAARKKFRSDLLSTEPWYSDFDISSRMLIEEGWNVQGDLSVINRQFLDFIEDSTRDLPAGIKSLKKLNDFWEQGLFEGVYATSQKFALREHLIPSIRRQHPDWTPRQIAAQAAENVNIMFSSQDKWQTVFRLSGAELREVTRALIFSTNESEGLIKGAIRAMNPRSPHFQQFAEWYAGTFLALAGIANLIHYTATGKVLPKESYNPINADDPYAPFGVGYSNRFLSPEMPFVRGRNNTAVYADLVGQMDTAFRWGMDPMSALSARTNVIPRALQNQLGSGTNFFGEPLQTPGQRVGQAALDLGAPIGVQNVVGAASEQFPPLQQAFPPAESRLGVTGQLFQASGINLRSPVNTELRELLERRPEMRLEIEDELERRQVEFARRSPDSLFTNVLKARLRQAREQGDALAIRAIEIELRNRGELEESSLEPVAPAAPTPQPAQAEPARDRSLPARRIEN